MTQQQPAPSWPPWFPRIRAHAPAEPASEPAPPDDHAPDEPKRTLGAALQMLWKRGGWDRALSPTESWERLVGTAYPGAPSAFAFGRYDTFGPLDHLLLDEDVTAVQLNGPGREVVVSRAMRDRMWQTSELWHNDWFPWLAEQLQQRGTGSSTILHQSGAAHVARPGVQPCIIRYEVVQQALCAHGPVLSLRIVRPYRLSLGRLVEQQQLSAGMASFLAGCVEAGVNILIVGAPGTGKTTMARTLLNLDTLADTRQVCVEEAPELGLRSPHAVSLVSDFRMTLPKLAALALRMAPTRLTLGELSGAEAYTLLAAMRAGAAVLTTIPGLNARHGLDAFIGMALEAPEARASVDLVRWNFNAQSLVIVALQWHDGRREVAEIAEILPTGGTGHPIVQLRWRRSELGEGWTRIASPSDALLQRLRCSANPLTLAEWDLAMGGAFQ